MNRVFIKKQEESFLYTNNFRNGKSLKISYQSTD